ncbi:iron-sulfur binding hydrogenase [Marispirochaeta aestuarii]|uniref:Iron-sulfur binding hydrogenase n=1 Tax=Marispirochaeta aestuarii TaxID=1963862 RepID=A0A1Y1RT17_9SPIO|nr:iron-sulfur binding hydrogenase [Marispirochaeta aestuarii]ORC30246.1 iron-sulfur binding hydrogenase [Marispirochaeta aestuarii]
MKITDLHDQLGYRTINLPDPDTRITDGYTSDLLSDVIANAPDGGVLITIQAHKNTIAVCGLAGLRAVVLCNDREPDEGMREAARSDGVAVFVTPKNQFRVSAEISKLL